MAKVIESWRATNKGDYILTLDTPFPDKFFNGYRIDGIIYDAVPVYFDGNNIDLSLSFRNIALNSSEPRDFKGKTVEFVKI